MDDGFAAAIRLIETKCPSIRWKMVDVTLPYLELSEELCSWQSGMDDTPNYKEICARFPILQSDVDALPGPQPIHISPFELFDLNQAPRLRAEGWTKEQIDLARRDMAFWHVWGKAGERFGVDFAASQTDLWKSLEPFNTEEQLQAAIKQQMLAYPRLAKRFGGKTKVVPGMLLSASVGVLDDFPFTKSSLMQAGYEVVDTFARPLHREFLSREQLQAYLDSIDQSDKIISSKKKDKCVQTIVLGPDNPHFRQYPIKQLRQFSTIDHYQENRMRFETPEYWSIDLRIINILIVKKNRKSQGLTELLSSAGTQGFNYRVTNQMVLNKAKAWHSAYGIKVLDASMDSFTILFDRLPDDLSPLCSEFFAFCGCLVQRGDEQECALQMKKMAENLRSSKRMTFWWD